MEYELKVALDEIIAMNRLICAILTKRFADTVDEISKEAEKRREKQA